MEIRPYTAADCDAVIALWNKCLHLDLINSENFYKRIVYDVNFDRRKFLLACENGELTGFIYGVKRLIADEISGLEPERGWIVAMGVSPSHSREGIGKALLYSMESAFRENGVKQVDVGAYANNYICPGVDKTAYAGGVSFFAANGYENKGECCSMNINLHGFVIPRRYVEKKKALEAEGYRFKQYEPADAIGLLDFMRQDFSWWLPAVREAIVAGRGEKTIILAQNGGGETVGFVLRAMDGTEERFGPFGIKPSLQGIGLGSVLFHEMMKQMVERRIYYTYFLWTGGRNLEIYAAWGMKIARAFSMMGKAL